MNEKQFADYVFDVVQRVIGKDGRFAIAKAYWEPETQCPRYDILVSRKAGECSIRIADFEVFSAQLGWGYKYYECKWVHDGKHHEPQDYRLLMIDGNRKLIQGSLELIKKSVCQYLEERVSLFA
jgi:hypothetical protein